MTDDTTDSRKPSHGAVWYFGWFLFLYVLSILPVAVVCNWIESFSHVPRPVGTALEWIYFPIIWLIEYFGAEEAASSLVERIISVLPSP